MNNLLAENQPAREVPIFVFTMRVLHYLLLQVVNQQLTPKKMKKPSLLEASHITASLPCGSLAEGEGSHQKLVNLNVVHPLTRD